MKIQAGLLYRNIFTQEMRRVLSVKNGKVRLNAVRFLIPVGDFEELWVQVE